MAELGCVIGATFSDEALCDEAENCLILCSLAAAAGIAWDGAAQVAATTSFFIFFAEWPPFVSEVPQVIDAGCGDIL